MLKGTGQKRRVGERSKKLRTGDRVVVIAGNAKGNSGVILACTGDAVLVEGANFCKKHVKRSQQHPNGGVVEIERPIHVSNVRPCTDDGRPLRLKVERNASGERELISMKNGERLVYRSIKKRSKK